MLQALLPRLAYTGFKFLQTILIETTINFVDGTGTRIHGQAASLVGSAVFIYTGSAVKCLSLDRHTPLILVYRFRMLCTMPKPVD
jgi:hypothetical protein